MSLNPLRIACMRKQNTEKLRLFTGIDELLSLRGARLKEARHLQEKDLSIVKKAALLCVGGRIAWVGPQKRLPTAQNLRQRGYKIEKEIALGGCQVLPGWVECHTHLVFAGARWKEFEARNRGLSYQALSKQGGGIFSTVRCVRRSSEKELLKSAQSRLKKFLLQGVTTLEIKSGYALNRKDELKTLRVIQQLQKQRGKGKKGKGSCCDIVSTFLGAHALPPEFKRRGRGSYLKYLKEKVLPLVQAGNLSGRVDIFIEPGFFSYVEGRAYLSYAQKRGFDLCIHADQLQYGGGSRLGIELGAKSIDHVVYIKKGEIQALAKSPTTAVLLPGADFYLNSKYPPARELLEAGVRVALATDFNPGSCPSQSLELMGVLARAEMKMTLPEVIGAYTLGAAYALGKEQEVGSLEVGKWANFLCLESDDWRSLFYEIRPQCSEKRHQRVYFRGKLQS